MENIRFYVVHRVLSKAPWIRDLRLECHASVNLDPMVPYGNLDAAVIFVSIVDGFRIMTNEAW